MCILYISVVCSVAAHIVCVLVGGMLLWFAHLHDQND